MSAIEKLLAREEERALEDLRRALVGLGETVAVATNLRSTVRAHPLLSVVSAAAVGFVTSPVIVRSLRGLGSSRAAARLLSTLPPGVRRQLVALSMRAALGSP